MCFLNHESLTIHKYEKMFKLSIRIMEREDIEICKITLKLIFRCNPLSRSGFEVCPPAPQHVLDIPLQYLPKLTI